jgi:hypothetical protein
MDGHAMAMPLTQWKRAEPEHNVNTTKKSAKTLMYLFFMQY